jgi:3-oxoacyl-[acyl-carrier protein] reductase
MNGVDALRVAAVTGGAGSIGSAVAIRLADAGFRLALLDVDERVHGVADEVGAAHRALLDLRDRDAVRRCLDEIAASLGGLHVLVNAAGTCHRESFEKTRPDDWHTDIDTNLSAVMWSCQAAVFPHMRAQGYGRIINIASVSGKVGGVGVVHEDGSGGRSGAGYAAAKAGTINLTRWIAREVGPWGITCNVIAPGPIASPMTVGQEYSFADAPIARFGTPTEVAHAVAFLAHHASGYMTGACLHVDGGMVRA